MRTILLLSLSTLLVADEPRISPENLLKAIDAYAPLLVMQAKEQYKVTSVESFLEVAEPNAYKEGGKDCIGLRLKNPKSTGFFSRLSTDDNRVKGGDPDRAKVYVNVKVGPTTTDIQYWFLYAFNGPGTVYASPGSALPPILPSSFGMKFVNEHLASGKKTELKEMGIHEGDWEHLTVRISNKDGQMLTDKAVFMSAHGQGGWYPPASVLMDRADGQGKQIWAYASLNGHALFPTPDMHYYSKAKSPISGKIVFALVNDTSTPGDAVDFGRAFRAKDAAKGREEQKHGPKAKGQAEEKDKAGDKDKEESRHKRWEIIGIQNDAALAKALRFTRPAWMDAFPDRWGRYVEKPHPFEDVKVLGTLTKMILDKTGLTSELTLEAGPQPPWKKDVWAKEAE